MDRRKRDTLTAWRAMPMSKYLDNTGLSYLWSKLKATFALKSHTHSYAAKSVSLTGTLTASGWSGSAAPYVQSVSVSGMTATLNGMLGLAMTAATEQLAAAQAAKLLVTAQASGTVTVKAFGTKPAVNIPISIVELG